MTKTLQRDRGGALACATTRLTMAALIGPVDRNKHSCAVTMHAMYASWKSCVSAIHTKGAATRVAIADSHR